MKMIILEDRTQGGTLNQKINVGDEIVEESFDIAPSLNFEGNSYLESQVHNGQVYLYKSSRTQSSRVRNQDFDKENNF